MTPLVSQCKSYGKAVKEALQISYNAYKRAKQAHILALATAQKISGLSTNINDLQSLNTGHLDNLSAAINRVKNNYVTKELSGEIQKLQAGRQEQKTKIYNYKVINLNIKQKVISYKALLNSLAGLAC